MFKSAIVAVVTTLAMQTSTAYQADVEKFRKNREAEIGSETGWIALTDLQWITKGDHTLGTGTKNDIVLAAPSAPDRLGTITVTDATVILHVAPGLAATVNGQRATDVELKPNSDAHVVVGGMTMAAIKRGARVGLRVWDRAAPPRLVFRGLTWFPIDPKWRVDAKFVPHKPGRTMKIQNIIGDIIDMPNPGVAVFTIDGKQIQLEALVESDDELFFMFKDGTSNKTTYGAGRYLYTPLPKNGRVTLDFNRAKNPPCAFTNYATCPLPPAQNRLTIPISAGELDYKLHGSSEARKLGSWEAEKRFSFRASELPSFRAYVATV